MPRFTRPVLALLVTLAAGVAHAGDAYVEEIDAWHEGREDRLRQPDGWLSLVGLIAVSEGTQSLGCGETPDLRIDSTCDPHIGDVVREGETVRFVAEAEVTHEGSPVDSIELAADTTGNPTVLESGSISFYLIERHGRYYLRVKDASAPLLSSFAGIDRWPVDAGWKIKAEWVEYDEPQKRLLPDVLGVPTEAMIAGEARFTRDGKEYVLFPNSMGDDWMFWVFGDATNGAESYGGGRFLYSDAPVDGVVVLDFNRSYNPPCVFTPYATCPLPAEGNTLDLEVVAGEQMFGAAH